MKIGNLWSSFMIVATSLLIAPAVFAEQAEAVASSGGDVGYKALAAGLAIGLAALGGGLGQGLTMQGALTGIARNPGASGKIFAPMILGLALIESLVIYALIIAFMVKP